MKPLSYATAPDHAAGGEETGEGTGVQMDGWKDEWMDGRTVGDMTFTDHSSFRRARPLRKLSDWLSVFLSVTPMCLPGVLTIWLCPFDILFISLPLSLHLLLFFASHPPPPLRSVPISSPLLSHSVFYSTDLLFASLPRPFLPFPRGIRPPAPSRLDLHQQRFPPRERNKMMNKRTETDKKLWGSSYSIDILQILEVGFNWSEGSNRKKQCSVIILPQIKVCPLAYQQVTTVCRSF